MNFAKTYILWLLLSGLLLPGFGSAQEASGPASSIERFSLSTGGTGLYRPEKWGMIKVSLRNPHDHDVELLATTYLEQDPTLQYGRRFWMPAQTRMVMWHPLRMPALQGTSSKFFDLRSMVLATAGGSESMTSNEFGAMQFDQGFRIAADEPVTAIVLDPGTDNDPNRTDPATFALTARFDRGLRFNFTILAEPLIPASEELFDAVDHMILASDRVVTDAAGISAIRRWVAAGGHLWVMADKVSPELLAAVMGDECSITEVDRVDLTTIQIDAGPAAPGPSSFHREVDKPVAFVRLLGDNLNPIYSVNGWPALLRHSYGDGEIYVTTLGGDGWVNLRRPTDSAPPGGPNYRTSFVPSGPLSLMALDFFTPRQSSQIPRDLAEHQIRQLIGYAIPDRSLVLGTLALFTILILVLAVLFSRVGRLEWMGMAIPGLALACSAVLLAAGWNSRSSIPATIALLQQVQPVPGTDEFRTTGVAGILSREETSLDLAGDDGGWMNPEMAGLEGTTRRIVWSDIDRWKWENLPARPGLRMVPFQTGGRVRQPLEATVRFDSSGIAGTLVLPPGLEPADAIIATSHGRIGVELQSAGEFVARADSVLGGDQYIAAHVLTDEQQRRNRVLSQLRTPASPRLLVWTKPWGASTSLLGDSQAVGSALVELPLEWERPIPGTGIVIPSPLLTIRELHGPDGTKPAGLYDRRTQRWVERTGPTHAWIGFQVPSSALPLEVTSALVTFKVLGPLQRLELSGFADQRRQSLKIWDTPVGTLQYEITDPRSIQLDSRGRLLLHVNVGRATDDISHDSSADSRPVKSRSTDPAAYWQFEDVSLQISGMIATPGQ